MVVTEISMIHHVGIVLFLLWVLNSYSYCHPIVYFVSLIYLYQVHERYSMRLKRKLQYEERKAANQRRILTDSESVRWLNYAVEKMWPICIEHIVSQRIFLAIIPWFLEKYKPWTVKRVSVQSLYLGRTPPYFTEMRVLRESTEDDHLVLELGLNFLTADDMGAVLVAKLTRRLGFGLVTKMHMTGMHVEGKVLIGVKFLRSWPFIGRLRVCFAEPPYFQMTVKPIFHHGLDVTELPGIAGWLDNLLATAFEETLVEPNMLVVDLEKFVSPEPENWFSVDVKEPVAHVNVEVIEAAELKPSDLNGLADPYVKGNLGPYRFKTQIQKKTLTPKWLEEFKVPICSWESQNELAIEVRDKDHFVDDILGKCSVNINDLRDGQRHDMWLPLENVKMGRLHLAITVAEVNGKRMEQTGEEVKIEGEKPDPLQCEMRGPGQLPTTSINKSQKVADNFEPIDVEGQKETGIWVHHPGSEVSQEWEPRKGKSRQTDTEILSQDTPKSSRQSSVHSENSSDDENKEGRKSKRNIIQRGLRKIFHRHHSNKEDQSNSFGHTVSSPHANVKPVHVKRVGVNLVMDDTLSEPTANSPKPGGGSSNEGSGTENTGKIKDRAKNLLKNAGKRSARHLKQALSRKGSDKFLDKPEEGVPLDSDLSEDDDSISSSLYDPSVGGIRINSSFISRADNDEAEPEEHIVHAVVTDSQRDVPEESTTKSTLDGPDGQNVSMTRGSDGNGDMPVEESLKAEFLQGKVNGEKIVET